MRENMVGPMEVPMKLATPQMASQRAASSRLGKQSMARA